MSDHVDLTCQCGTGVECRWPGHIEQLGKLIARIGAAEAELAGERADHALTRSQLDTRTAQRDAARELARRVDNIHVTEYAALQARFAATEAERDALQTAGERMVTPEVHQAVQDRLRGELYDARRALRDIRDLGGLGTAGQIARRYFDGLAAPPDLGSAAQPNDDPPTR